MPTAKELDKAARQMEKEDWSPTDPIKRMIKENRGGRSRAEMEKVQLENEERRNPEEYRKSKELYEAGMKMQGMKKGGKTKCMAKGGYVKAADGCAQRGKTRGRIV